MKYCSEFNNVLTFFPDKIRSCCVLGNLGPVYYENYNGDIKTFDFEYLKAKKKEIYEQQLNEIFNNLPCENCFYLKDKTDEDRFSPKFSLVYLNSWTQCNCGCFYCDRLKYSKGKITKRKEKSEYYDLLPIIKGLYKHDLLDRENLRVVFHGGDFSVLKEFKPVVKTFLKYGIRKIDFSSNNIIFHPIVKDLLAKKKASLNMSLDCGTRETYKLIKRVDKFNDVIKNLKKYVKASKSDSPEINVKYILLKDVNDNEKEIQSFIQTMKNIGITRVSLHLEHKYANELFENKNKIPIHYKNLINLFFELCKENNFYYDTPDDVMDYIMTNL
ncbi:radical SAM protein [bacterium]|nr:radical SAM protein [bacterium]